MVMETVFVYKQYICCMDLFLPWITQSINIYLWQLHLKSFQLSSLNLEKDHFSPFTLFTLTDFFEKKIILLLRSLENNYTSIIHN